MEPIHGELNWAGGGGGGAGSLLFFTTPGWRGRLHTIERALLHAFANRFDRIRPRDIEAVEALGRAAGDQLTQRLRPCREPTSPEGGWSSLLELCRRDDFSHRLCEAAVGKGAGLPSPWSGGLARCRESYTLGSGMTCLRFVDGENSFFLMQRISSADAIYVPSSHSFLPLGYFHSRYASELIQHWIENFRANLEYAQAGNEFGGIIASQARPAHFFYETLPDLARIIETPEIVSRLPRIISRSNHDFADLDRLSPTTRNETLDLAAIETLRRSEHVWFLQIGTHRYFQKKNFSYEACDQLFLDRTLATLSGHAEGLKRLLEGCPTLVWVGIEGQKRRWVEQEEGLILLLNRLSERFPGLGVVFDGWTQPLTPARNNQRQADSERTIALRIAAGLQPGIRWISLVGETSHTKLVIARTTDFCLCSFSTASLYVSRFLGKPGFFHLSRREAVRFLGENLQKHGHRHAVLLPLEMIRDLPADGPGGSAGPIRGRRLKGGWLRSLLPRPSTPQSGSGKIVPLSYSIDPQAFWTFIEPRLPRLLAPEPPRLRLFIEPGFTVPAAVRRSIRMAVHGNLIEIAPTRGPTGRLDEFACRSEFFLANQLFYGLFAYGAHRRLPLPADHLIWMGDPLRRIRRQTGTIAKRERSRRAERTAADVMRDSRRRMLDNPCTRLVSGRPGVPFGACHEGMLEQAIEHLRNHFVFIGIAERRSQSIRRLCHRMDWDESLFREDILTPSPGFADAEAGEWGEEEREAAEPLIHLDRRLLEAAVKLIDGTERRTGADEHLGGSGS